MEITPELQAIIEDKAKEIAEEKAKEIVKQVTEESESRIKTLNEKHAAEVKTYKDSITAIIAGKGEPPKKTKIETLIDEINARRQRSEIKSKG